MPEAEEQGFEILVRLHDTMQASMLREILEDEGIPVATPGLNHRASMGAVFAHIEVVVQVPRADYAKAAELMTAFTGLEPVHRFEPTGEDTEGEGPYRAAAGFAREELEGEEEEDEEEDEEEEPEPVLPPRPAALDERKLSVIVGAALFFPGGGHIYVQRYKAALVLFLLTLLVIYYAFAVDSALFLGWPLLVAMDIVVARGVAREVNARLLSQAEEGSAEEEAEEEPAKPARRVRVKVAEPEPAAPARKRRRAKRKR